MLYATATNTMHVHVTKHLQAVYTGIQVNNLLYMLYTVCERGGDQAYSRLSTTHGHITDCMLDSVGGVCRCYTVYVKAFSTVTYFMK